MSNVPPPVKVDNASVSVYFHNDLLLNPIKSNVGFTTLLKNLIKKQYKKSKNKKCRSCRTECKFRGMSIYGRRYDQDGNDIDELLVAYLQN